MKKISSRLLSEFLENTLFRNSIYLMLGTGVLAGFGFIFWLINAHLFSIENIGLATTLISVMNLIAYLSLVGFDTVFVRFLPKSTQKSEKMNTGLILVSIASTLLGIGFLFGVNIISPKLAFITKNPAYELIFVLSCVMNAINVLTDSVFLAGRKTQFTLIVNFLLSVFKIATPFLFISFGAMGIFIASALSQTLGTILSIGIMTWKFDYHPKLEINRSILKLVWRYSAANYVAGVMNLLPQTILPILITNNIGPKASAYYYIIMMIGNLLYTIPQSVTRSLFAEGSHDEKSLEKNVKKAIKIITMLIVPAIVILLIFGRMILQIFGKTYANDGIVFLYLVVLTGIIISVNSILGSFFKIRKNLKNIIFTNFFYTVAIIGASYLLLPIGLVGVGIAWLIGNLLSAVINFVLFKSKIN
jgi:O-antigen/teichoic acid export membrane protein